ncbi:hypothetical protein, partial [Deinococcus pimensis]|uniref:hypothetical protein n=1 Tax=Deinococcus pimensis TaxID=309888 RepID=UPI0005EB6C41
AEHGLSLVGEPELVHNWQISSLHRLVTSGGDVYLKAVPPYFDREGALTEWLHARFPTLVPRVLARDPSARL